MKPIHAFFLLFILLSGLMSGLALQKDEPSGGGGWRTFLKPVSDGALWNRGARPALTAFGRSLLYPRDFFSSTTGVVSLEIPGPTADPVIPVEVSTNLDEACVVEIDVDLSHDGRFHGAGELGYARGFLTGRTGEVRLHGLVHGRYQIRARVTTPRRHIVSEVQTLDVLPPHPSHLPVSFERNVGQTDSQVLFLGRVKNQMVYITATETVLVRGARCQRAGADPGTLATCPTVQRFRLVGANSYAYPAGHKELPGKCNYFIGNDPKKWRTDIETYQEIMEPEVYPGIDVVYHSSQGRLEYDFLVSPGADPGEITIEFPDAKDVSIDVDGRLVLHVGDGQELYHSAPAMYQWRRGAGISTELEAVKGEWVLKGPRQAGFVITAYDPARELVIDPIVFSTYVGGNADDQGNAIAVDAAGNSYVTGSTMSANFPTTAGVLQTTAGGGGNSDVFILKLNPAGTALLYSTYLGGTGTDNGNGIAVDPAGNAYVTGDTSGNFPTTAGAFQTTYQGNNTDAFVAKLNPTGSTLVYSTYLGASNDEVGNAIAVDAAGNAYVTGWTGSNNFPTTPGVVQTLGGASTDAFVTKLNPTGTALVYSTFHGGNGLGSSGSGIAVDAPGNVYVTGNTSAPNMPTTAGAFQTVFGGGARDGFVLKLNPTATARVYSTFLGGNAGDLANGIAVDAAGNAYIGGQTRSVDFPVTPGAFQTNPSAIFPGGFVGFITKLNPTGTGLVYSTYLGTTGGTGGHVNAIAIDAAGNAYVTGLTNGVGGGFPLVNAFQTIYGTNSDAFVSVLNPAGSALVMSSYLGGNAKDEGFGIGLDGANNIYVVGATLSTNFPRNFPTGAFYQPANAGGNDAFITKINIPPPPVPGVTVTESGASTDVTEGGNTDTYTVVLNGVPTANVTITVTPDNQEWVSTAALPNPPTAPQVNPLVLTFTPANWNVPQTVTVTAVDDAVAQGPHTGTITHTAVSTDAGYNGFAIPDVIVNITDNDVAPLGTSGPEGSYLGDQAPEPGPEGDFGLRAQDRRGPRLRGPLRIRPDDLLVFNVSHRQNVGTEQADTGLGLWSLAGMALALMAILLIFVKTNRPT